MALSARDGADSESCCITYSTSDGGAHLTPFSVLWCVAVSCQTVGPISHHSACCSALQCVAVRCSVLSDSGAHLAPFSALQCVAVCSSVLSDGGAHFTPLRAILSRLAQPAPDFIEVLLSCLVQPAWDALPAFNRVGAPKDEEERDEANRREEVRKTFDRVMRLFGGGVCVNVRVLVPEVSERRGLVAHCLEARGHTLRRCCCSRAASARCVDVPPPAV